MHPVPAEYSRRGSGAIIDYMGPRCRRCGTVRHLTLDVTNPAADVPLPARLRPPFDHHLAHESATAAYYLCQLKAGNLRVLCMRCNTAVQYHRSRP